MHESNWHGTKQRLAVKKVPKNTELKQMCPLHSEPTRRVTQQKLHTSCLCSLVMGICVMLDGPLFKSSHSCTLEGFENVLSEPLIRTIKHETLFCP